MSLDYDFSPLLRKMESLDAQVKKKMGKDVLMKGADVMHKGQLQDVPVGDSGNLMRSLGIGKVTLSRGTTKIHVGIINAQEREVVYGYYQHYGTRRMVGKYWISKAYKRSIQESVAVMKEELRYKLREGLK